MKYTCWIWALGVFSASAFAQDYRWPNSHLQAFGCGPTSVAAGTVCYDAHFHGETLNDHPVKADLQAQLIAAPDESGGVTRAVARLRIVKLDDPTDIYDPDGTMPLLIRAKVCGFHRQCSWSVQSASVIMNRTPNQRYFENSAELNFDLRGISGAEETSILSQVDIWLPMQAYPITIKFSDNM